MRKIKGADTMFMILVAVIAVILAAVIYYMVYGMARSGTSAAGMTAATGQWAVPPTGTGTATAIITIKTTGSITINKNPACSNVPQGVQYTVSWNVAGQIGPTGQTGGSPLTTPITLGAGQVATATLQFTGSTGSYIPSVVYCTIETSQGTLSVQIS